MKKFTENQPIWGLEGGQAGEKADFFKMYMTIQGTKHYMKKKKHIWSDISGGKSVGVKVN